MRVAMSYHAMRHTSRSTTAIRWRICPTWDGLVDPAHAHFVFRQMASSDALVCRAAKWSYRSMKTQDERIRDPE